MNLENLNAMKNVSAKIRNNRVQVRIRRKGDYASGTFDTVEEAMIWTVSTLKKMSDGTIRKRAKEG